MKLPILCRVFALALFGLLFLEVSGCSFRDPPTITKIAVVPSSAYSQERLSAPPAYYPTVSESDQRVARAVFEHVAQRFHLTPTSLGGDENLLGKAYILQTRTSGGPEIVSSPIRLGMGAAIIGIDHGFLPNLAVEAQIQSALVFELRKRFGPARVRVDVMPAGIAF